MSTAASEMAKYFVIAKTSIPDATIIGVIECEPGQKSSSIYFMATNELPTVDFLLCIAYIKAANVLRSDFIFLLLGTPRIKLVYHNNRRDYMASAIDFIEFALAKYESNLLYLTVVESDFTSFDILHEFALPVTHVRFVDKFLTPVSARKIVVTRRRLIIHDIARVVNNNNAYAKIVKIVELFINQADFQTPLVSAPTRPEAPEQSDSPLVSEPPQHVIDQDRADVPSSTNSSSGDYEPLAYVARRLRGRPPKRDKSNTRTTPITLAQLNAIRSSG